MYEHTKIRNACVLGSGWHGGRVLGNDIRMVVGEMTLQINFRIALPKTDYRGLKGTMFVNPRLG